MGGSGFPLTPSKFPVLPSLQLPTELGNLNFHLHLALPLGVSVCTPGGLSDTLLLSLPPVRHLPLI